MVIIETSVFSRLIQELMSDEDYRALQEALINRPESGDIIQRAVVCARFAGSSKDRESVEVFA